MKKKAFTLAEILITLAIIGIISAMTIPTLIAKIHEKQNITRLKQTYSLLSQAFKLVEDNGGVLSDLAANQNTSKIDRVKKLADLLRPHLKILVDCGHNDKNEVCVKNQTYLQLNNTSRGNYSKNQNYYKIGLVNGVHIIFNAGEGGWNSQNGDPETFRIYVDTNGLQGPNQWGRDFFMFHYYDSYGLVPAGFPNSSKLEDKCESTKEAGLGCAYHVLKYGNMDYLKK